MLDTVAAYALDVQVQPLPEDDHYPEKALEFGMRLQRAGGRKA